MSRKTTVGVVTRPDSHEPLAALLERHGYSVTSAVGTVIGAATAIMDAKPDIVVLDVDLPDGSGVDFCRELTAVLPDVAVVLRTPTVTEDLEVAALAAGAAAIVEMSVRAASLLEAMAGVATVPIRPRTS